MKYTADVLDDLQTACESWLAEYGKSLKSDAPTLMEEPSDVAVILMAQLSLIARIRELEAAVSSGAES